MAVDSCTWSEEGVIGEQEILDVAFHFLKGFAESEIQELQRFLQLIQDFKENRKSINIVLLYAKLLFLERILEGFNAILPEKYSFVLPFSDASFPDDMRQFVRRVLFQDNVRLEAFRTALTEYRVIGDGTRLRLQMQDIFEGFEDLREKPLYFMAFPGLAHDWHQLASI